MRPSFAISSFLLLAALCLTSCATRHGQPYDYTTYRQRMPRSILVLPPLNKSPDVNATYSLLTHATMPLAEAGYYVFPVGLVDETFKQNGFTSAVDIQTIAPAKLREIFGADAVLSIIVTEYGVSYRVVDSVVTVSADAKLVDLETGNLLWQGSATASSAEEQNNSGGGLTGALVVAVINQIINNVTDSSHRIAGRTSDRLLSTGISNGILYGPRSPRFGKDGFAVERGMR